MTAAKSWRCPCGAVNADTHPDGSRVGTCPRCFEYRPSSARATVRADRLRAGDTILGGYVMDAQLRPVRRIVR